MTGDLIGLFVVGLFVTLVHRRDTHLFTVPAVARVLELLLRNRVVEFLRTAFTDRVSVVSCVHVALRVSPTWLVSGELVVGIEIVEHWSWCLLSADYITV